MSRCKKLRMVSHMPPVGVFKPAGIPVRRLVWSTLSLDEYEAMRLADLEGLTQEQVARRLGVSRPTVSRILAEARRKVAGALTYGRALVIRGGSVAFEPAAAAPRCGRGSGCWSGRVGPRSGGTAP